MRPDVPPRQELLSPERVESMAKEMQAFYAERVRSLEARADAAPKELQDLDARLARLRERARSGDPDITAERAAGDDRAGGRETHGAARRAALGETLGQGALDAAPGPQTPIGARLRRDSTAIRAPCSRRG